MDVYIYMYVYIYIYVTFLHSKNSHNIVNQLYFNKTFKNEKIYKQKTTDLKVQQAFMTW